MNENQLDKFPNHQLKLGKSYRCKRKIDGNKDGRAETLIATLYKRRTISQNHTQYYVHYESQDRRLDEWVNEDCLLDEIQISGSMNRYRRGFGNRNRNLTKPSDESSQFKHLNTSFHDFPVVRNINRIQLGIHEMDCWYFSPYPGKYGKSDKLYICEKTFKYFRKKKSYKKYLDTLNKEDPPPGKRIYHDPQRKLVVYRIDGSKEVVFGQNLCLFGKLFIEHKTLSYDSTPFWFFILYEEEVNSNILYPVGYFSKEKDSKEQYNLACIVVLPPYQCKGYGKFIISLSYEVTKQLGSIGSPEKPLSDLGKISYRSYWTYVVLKYFDMLDEENMNQLSLSMMSYSLGIKANDILSVIHHLNMMHHLKGQLVIKINRFHVKEKLQPYLDRNYELNLCRSELLQS